ncbi:hypothetical protein BFS35_012185 [Macrococcoides goetzii]|uniref:YopX protein domain-containing protein n=1 Tax=Macrococcoides goetzii TaxID=1891097 RepID=A0A2G5NXA0_9STAP|nr:YopX family protein [Macrococcus goetzii]RAI79312.1 hypothetical protein BFS35_012185 [Macrococcus goetzii]
MIPKFRAWDKEKKIIDIVDGIKFDEDEVWEISFPGDCWRDASNYVLMQSTGLTDKNGIEIFEGDIINCRDLWLDGDRRKTNKQIVKYDSGMFSAGYVSLRTNNSTSEIIGNIYENPELL